MKMKTQCKLALVSLVLTIACPVRADDIFLKAATISSGAATLNNGSVVNIGQPFVGLMSAAGGGGVNAGLIPVLQSTNSPAPPRPILSSTPTFDGGVLRLTLTNLSSQAELRYVLQASTNLTDWVSLSTNMAIGLTLTLEDREVAKFEYRFYRVGVQ